MCGSDRVMANTATQSIRCVTSQDQDGLMKELTDV